MHIDLTLVISLYGIVAANFVLFVYLMFTFLDNQMLLIVYGIFLNLYNSDAI